MVKYTKTTFGEMLDFEVPPGCTQVVVCVDHRLAGHKPKTLLLPHQVYRHTMLDLLKECGNSAESITVIPVNTAYKFTVKRSDIEK